MRQRIKTGELNKRLNYYDFSISKRQLQRWAHSKRLPYFLQHVKRTKKGDYRWNWLKIERTLIEFEIEILADFIQREQGGNIAKIKRHLFWLLDVYAHFTPRHEALKDLYTLFSPMWKEPQRQEQIMQFWEHETKPKLITEIEKRLKHGKLDFP